MNQHKQLMLPSELAGELHKADASCRAAITHTGGLEFQKWSCGAPDSSVSKVEARHTTCVSQMTAMVHKADNGQLP